MLADVAIADVRADLPVGFPTGKTIGRFAAKTSCTLHYNGPAIAGVETWSRARLMRFIRDVDVPNHLSRLNADGLQYHYVVTSSGEVLQTRDLDAILWHCANSTGNKESIAVHLPLGTGQTPAPEQWQATTRLFDTLIADFKMAGRSAIRGHKEWPKYKSVGGRLVQVPNSLCPGEILMAMLRTWRGMQRFRVTAPAGARVRQGPSVDFPVALGGRAVLPFGDVFDADKVLEGNPYQDNPYWAHRADGLGFVHMSVLESV